MSNIILKSKENFTSTELYSLMKSPNIEKMSEHAGQTIEMESYMVYEKADYTTGEMKKVLVIKPRGEHALATNSVTCITEFEDIYNMFKESNELDKFTKIEILKKTSKKGRQFITCALVEQ